jgi:hypothetical protein
MAEYERFDRCITFTKEPEYKIISVDVEQIIGFEVSETGTCIKVEIFTSYASAQGAGFIFFKERNKGGGGDVELIHTAIFEFLRSKKTYLNLNSIDLDALREKAENAGKVTRALKAMR